MYPCVFAISFMLRSPQRSHSKTYQKNGVFIWHLWLLDQNKDRSCNYYTPFDWRKKNGWHVEKTVCALPIQNYQFFTKDFTRNKFTISVLPGKVIKNAFQQFNLRFPPPLHLSKSKVSPRFHFRLNFYANWVIFTILFRSYVKW